MPCIVSTCSLSFCLGRREGASEKDRGVDRRERRKEGTEGGRGKEVGEREGGKGR